MGLSFFCTPKLVQLIRHSLDQIICGLTSADPIFYPNLWLYIPRFLNVLGCSLVFSYQYFIFLINLMTGLLTFSAFKRLSARSWLALFLTFLYITNPFRLNDLYIRCALGESLALTFLPVFFVSFYQCVYGSTSSWKSLAFAAFGILHSHLLSVGLTAAVSVVFVLISLPWLVKHGVFSRMLAPIKAIGVVLLTSLWFVVPLMDKMGMELSILSSNSISNSSLNLLSLFSLDNYFNSSTTLGPGFGLLLISVIILCFFLLRDYHQNRFCCSSAYIWQIFTSIFMVLFCIYFASDYFPWSWVQIHCPALMDMLNNFQYAWRINGYTLVFGLILFGLVFRQINDNMFEKLAYMQYF